MAEKYISQFTAAEIDERLAQVSEKYGYIRTSYSEDTSYYSLECFNSEQDAEEGKESLQVVEIPIPTKTGNVYTARLKSTLSNTTNIVISDNSLIVPLNYQAVLIAPDQTTNAGVAGTLIVQRKTSTTEWTTVAEMSSRLASQDTDSVYEEVDLTEYVVSGKQQIRLQATYSYTNEEGEEKTVRSGYVMVGADVTKTKLYLQLLTEYTTPIEAWKSTGAANPFEVKYVAYGAAWKTLKIQVQGSVATNTLEQTFAEDGAEKGVSLDENSAYGYLTHGMHEVRAWLECSDGMGGTLKSETLVNQFMVVNAQSEGYDATKRYFLLQNLASTVTNFVQSELCRYTVYAPDKATTNVTFQLTDSKNNAYFEADVVAEHMKEGILLATVEIEPESDINVVDSYPTRFYVYRDETVNFLQESSGNNYLDVLVDNTKAIIPVTGATFLLNPKTRSNDESNPKRILNEKAGNAEVESEWENFGFINDGWITTEDKQKVLRIMAGEKLTIKQNVFAQFLENPASSMTIDIDFKVSNVTDVDNPLISILGGTNKGLLMNALKGWIRTASYNDSDNCMFAWREEQRLYLSLNIHHAVRPNLGIGDVHFPAEKATQATETIAFARILINGDPVREIPFDKTSLTEWCDGESSIIIGNDGADVDIYSLRIYEKTQIDWKQLALKNYPASLPTTEEKQKVVEKNDLYDGMGISLTKAREKGLNCIIYHGGGVPYYADNGEKRGWVEYYRYDQNGNELKEYSGTYAMNSYLADNENGGVESESQGTTAESYWDFNVQNKSKSVKLYIDIPVTKLHENIHVSEPYEKDGSMYVDLYGGNLGELEPFDPQPKAYAYANGYVHVPDGWIDGNGMYRGRGYQVAPNTAQALKNVNKINYASSLQSHLLGACKSYDELHFECVGASPLQQAYIDNGLQRPVSAKHLEPFLVFEQKDGEDTPKFIGLGTYGAGKMDNVAWGYVEDLHPKFAMIEGSDNNPPLTNFLVPFDKHHVVYSPSAEGWVYAGETSFDFDAGKKYEDANGVEYPVADLEDRWARFHNFVYLNSTNITYFDGGLSDFNTATKDINKKYWLTSGSTYADGGKKFCLFRYDKASDEWVDAGLYDETSGAFKVMDLKTDARTAAIVAKYENTTRYDEMNAEIIAEYARFMKAHGEYFIRLRSLLFNYCFVLMFLAGTDNSAKNTYYKIDPIAQSMTRNEEFATWWGDVVGEEFDFDNIYQIYMDGDDLDSILPFNNKGNLTKPYYIERLYPYADGSTVNLYEGVHNQLFNFVEHGFTQTEREEMMNLIMRKMVGLVSESDNLLGLQSNKVSLWGFMHKYFFNVQNYFPQVAYIEQARIRYEFAELMGHRGARDVRPISQSLGAQLENEQQYMEQRLVYMASFAVFGQLGNEDDGNIGLPDLFLDGSQLQFQADKLPDGSPATIEMTVTPHQYLYPCGFNGDSPKPSHQRTSPKQTCTVTIATGVTGLSDTTMGLRGANYYSDYGRIEENLSTRSAFTLVGKRLKDFLATSPGSAAKNAVFKPSSFTLDAPNLVNFRASALPIAEIDASSLIRCKTIQHQYSTGSIKLPSTHTLDYVRIGTRQEYLHIDNCPNLRILELGAITYTKEIVIGENVGVNTSFTIQPIIEVFANNAHVLVLETLQLSNINFTNLSKEVMSWMLGIENLELKGKISLAGGTGTDYLSYADTVKMIERFGNVQSETNGLYVDYPKFPINGMTVEGSKYIRKTGEWSGWNLSLLPAIGNNVAISGKREAVRWSFAEDGYTQYATWKDAVKGVLQVNALQENAKFTLHVEMDTLLDDGTVKTLSFDKKVGFYDRKPKLNDFAYGDGEFDDELDLSKDLVGNVIYLKEETDGKVNGFVFAKENVTLKSTEVLYTGSVMNSASAPWGIYPVTDTTTESEKTYGFDEETQEEIRQSLASIYPSITLNEVVDLPMTNLYDTGMDNEDGSTRYYLTDINEYGDSPFIDKNKSDGYAAVSGDVSINRFDPVGEADIVMQRVADMYNTYFISEDDPLETAEVQPTTLEELANQMVLRANQANSDNDTMPTKHYQLYFPATHAARLYEPAVTEGRTLHDMYKRGKWQLPSTGLMARVFNFYYNSCGIEGEDGTVTRRKLTSEGGAFGAQFANESEPFEALMPLFANLYARILNKMPNASLTSPYVFPTASNYWTGTEYHGTSAWLVYFGSGYFGNNYKRYSYVGRGVAAFEFTPTE